MISIILIILIFLIRNKIKKFIQYYNNIYHERIVFIDHIFHKYY
jgi:hypothetical protein